MKKYSLDSVFYLMYRYVWIVCAVVILLEIVFTAYNSIQTVRQSSEDTMYATKHELENKLNVTWKLADALGKDILLSDTSISLEERAKLLKPYNDVYDLFLIGITDEKGKITSTYDDIPGNIGERDYFKKVIATGTSVITDAFPAGADNTTLNYTICVPYFDNSDTPSGTIIMSIPFDGVNETIVKYSPANGFMFTLLSSNNEIMAEYDESLLGTEFSDLVNDSIYISEPKKELIDSVEQGEIGNYWTIQNGKLLYVSYVPIEHTPWKLLISIDAISSNKMVFLVLILKSFLLCVLLFSISYFGEKFAKSKLKGMEVLLSQISKLQDNLREEKLIMTDTFKEFAEVSQSGLLDSLTGLPTRLGVEHKLKNKDCDFEKKQGVFVIIDVDNLKGINDTYGHKVGDLAISSIGKKLKSIAAEYGGIASRFGGDEFIVCFFGINTKSIVELLWKSFQIDLELKQSVLSIHSSIGAAEYPECGTNFQQLFICADKALYEAKLAGKDCYCFYDLK